MRPSNHPLPLWKPISILALPLFAAMVRHLN